MKRMLFRSTAVVNGSKILKTLQMRGKRGKKGSKCSLSYPFKAILIKCTESQDSRKLNNGDDCERRVLLSNLWKYIEDTFPSARMKILDTKQIVIISLYGEAILWNIKGVKIRLTILVTKYQ